MKNNVKLEKSYQFKFPEGLVTWSGRFSYKERFNNYKSTIHNQFDVIENELLDWIEDIKLIGDLCIELNIYVNNTNKYRTTDVDNYLKLFLDLSFKRLNLDDKIIKKIITEKHCTDNLKNCLIELKLFIKPYPDNYLEELKLAIPLSKEHKKNVAKIRIKNNRDKYNEYARNFRKNNPDKIKSYNKKKTIEVVNE